MHYTGAQSAGHINIVAVGWNDAMSSITAYLKGGQMRPLAVMTPQRDPGLPGDVNHGGPPLPGNWPGKSRGFCHV